MKKLVWLFAFIFLTVFRGSSAVGDTLSIESQLKGRDDVVFFGGFEEAYADSVWRHKWGIPWEDRVSSSEIVYDSVSGNRSLRVNYPEGGVGPGQSGAQFPMVFGRMKGIGESSFQSLYLRYYLKFEAGFDFNRGGKLPGLIGGGDSWSRSGGHQPDGSNGWSMRFMWRSNGQLVVYAYLPVSGNQKWGGRQWGQDIDLNFKVQPEKWHCIEQYIDVGEPGKDNGALKVWIDGLQCLEVSDLRFWNVDNHYGKIGGIYFSTFHGGNAAEWAPQNDCSVLFDSFVVAKERIGLATRINSSKNDGPDLRP